MGFYSHTSGVFFTLQMTMVPLPALRTPEGSRCTRRKRRRHKQHKRHKRHRRDANRGRSSNDIQSWHIMGRLIPHLWWENDGKMMGKWWEHVGKMMGKWWENDGNMLGKWWENDGNMLGKWWENDGKMMGICWENDGNMLGTCWENDGKMMGKWWENDGKMMGKWGFMGIERDFYRISTIINHIFTTYSPHTNHPFWGQLHFYKMVPQFVNAFSWWT